MLKNWQKRWEQVNLGRYNFSINPHVDLRLWFLGLNLERKMITSISRLILNHNRINSHLNRIKIVETAIWNCGDSNESVDHILWRCRPHETTRPTLMQQIDGFVPSTSIRDLLAQRGKTAVQACVWFLTSILPL
jgi:hypothetical protein